MDDISEQGALERFAGIASKLHEAYQRSPVLRVLVALNPALAAAEAGISATFNYFQARRLEVFAEEFTTLGLSIQPEDTRRQEFFDAYTSTARHVLAESRESKVRLFARLFGTFVRDRLTTPIDRYEEHLSILDEISEREFNLLLLLRRHESGHPIQANENENYLQRSNRFWPDFEAEAEGQFGVSREVLQAMLTRLGRTGMYQEITGTFWDYTGGRGYLTHSFDDFLSALGISQSDSFSTVSAASGRNDKVNTSSSVRQNEPANNQWAGQGSYDESSRSKPVMSLVFEELKAKILSLNDMIGPRTLLEDERARMIELLKPHAGQGLDFRYFTELETDGFSKQLLPVFQLASWEVSVTPFKRIEPFYGVLCGGWDLEESSLLALKSALSIADKDVSVQYGGAAIAGPNGQENILDRLWLTIGLKKSELNR